MLKNGEILSWQRVGQVNCLGLIGIWHCQPFSFQTRSLLLALMAL